MADNANIRALLMSNAKWAAGVSAADPNRFPNSANNPQKPHVRPFVYSTFHNIKLLLVSLDRLFRFQSARVGHHRFRTWSHLCSPKYRKVRFSRLFSPI